VSWLEDAACRGMRWFVFEGVPRGRHNAPRERYWARRRKVCADCPVRVECAEAGRDEPVGMWGGLRPEQRWRTPLAAKIGRGDVA